MKSIIIAALISLGTAQANAAPIQQCVSFLLSNALFPQNISHCTRYGQNMKVMKAITILATNMNYTLEELCTHERILDIFVDKKNIYNAANDTIEPHIWVTLHYNEYSCQYFVRESDMIVTRKNCYNTF